MGLMFHMVSSKMDAGDAGKGILNLPSGANMQQIGPFCMSIIPSLLRGNIMVMHLDIPQLTDLTMGTGMCDTDTCDYSKVHCYDCKQFPLWSALTPLSV